MFQILHAKLTKKQMIPSRYRIVRNGALDILVIIFASCQARKPVMKKSVNSKSAGTKKMAGINGE